MRYAFFIFVLLIQFNLLAKNISQFHQSKPLMTVIEFIQLGFEDQNVHLKIHDHKIEEKFQKCSLVESIDAINEFNQMIKAVVKLYPDEELPILEARNDFKEYIGNVKLKKCINEIKDQGKLIVSYMNDQEAIYFSFEKVSP